MIVFKEAAMLQKHIGKLRAKGLVIGFVPTMGALHKGHLSLVDASKAQCDVTVASIFVNPTQFNDPNDFEKYPVTLNEDVLLLENTKCDILFLPSVQEMYPLGTHSAVTYKLGDMEHLLEGKYRKGHFQGVCLAVHKLLNLVDPDYLYTGQKDYQQYLILKKLVQLTNKKTNVIKVNTYRESNGLAMSSRNLRLSDQQKEIAAAISKTLTYIKENAYQKPLRELEKIASDYLLNNGFSKVDYVSIVDADTLQPVNSIKNAKVVALIAAFINGVRLIDNIVLNDPSD